MVSVSASVNLPVHHKVQKFSSGTDSSGLSRKKGRKTVVRLRVCVCVCVCVVVVVPDENYVTFDVDICQGGSSLFTVYGALKLNAS